VSVSAAVELVLAAVDLRGLGENPRARSPGTPENISPSGRSYRQRNSAIVE
jgi:hypothetical protein